MPVTCNWKRMYITRFWWNYIYLIFYIVTVYSIRLVWVRTTISGIVSYTSDTVHITPQMSKYVNKRTNMVFVSKSAVVSKAMRRVDWLIMSLQRLICFHEILCINWCFINVSIFKRYNLFKLSFVKNCRMYDKYHALIDFFTSSSEFVDLRLNFGIFLKFLGAGIE